MTDEKADDKAEATPQQDVEKTPEETPEEKPKHTLAEKELAQHIPVIRNYLRKIVRREEVDDAVQTVLARALENLHKYRGDSSPRVWLLGIARNVGYEQARTRQKAPILASKEHDESSVDLGQAPAIPIDTQEELMGRKQEHGLALYALDGLSLDEKLALLVTYVDGVPGPDAAKILGISFAAFRQRLSRARQAMAKELDKVLDKAGEQPDAAEVLQRWQAVLNPKQRKEDLKK